MILLYVLVEMVAYVLQNQRFIPQFHERNILLFLGFFANELKHFFLSGNFKFDGARTAHPQQRIVLKVGFRFPIPNSNL